MAIIKIVSILFFLIISLGTGLFSFLVNSKMTGAGFVRLVTGVCAGSLTLGLIVLLTATSSQAILMMGLASLIVMIITYKFHKDEKSLFMWILFFIQNSLLIALLFFYAKEISGDGSFIKNFFFILSSALLFGIVNYAMILGHYYLVVPKLSEKPLIVSMKITWFFILIKLCFSTLATLGAKDFFVEETTLGAGYSFNWIMLIMRYLWGYAAVGILSYFAWKLSKIRSTQSATGVMYVMVFFAIVGELISLYLFQQFGLFI
jgi:hypothetical protein